MLVINPKRINEELENRPYWYNYYAGYSHTFIKRIIESSNLKEDSIILDPWNGSGTTTLVASMLGYRSIGIDLNPVMKVISLSKMADISDVLNSERQLGSISIRARGTLQKNDPLSIWLQDDSVCFIRNIEKQIIGNCGYPTIEAKVNSLTISQCLIYTTLFNVLRKHLIDFIPSNPTWIKKPKESSQRIGIERRLFKSQLIETIKEMVVGTRIAEHLFSSQLADIRIASSSSLPLGTGTIDFVVTSPPYCTRIDYGVATYPELALLAVDGEDEIDSVRRGLMGTTTVPKIKTSEIPKDCGTECLAFIESVTNHSSKASMTYYLKNFIQYFDSLNKSISEISRVIKAKGKFVCVVQDSYYKEIHCCLPSIVADMASNKGLNVVDQVEFESRQNMANVNNAAKKYRTKTKAIESVIIFEKSEV